VLLSRFVPLPANPNCHSVAVVTCRTLAFFERNHRGNRYKRIVLFGETFIASVQIEEAKLSETLKARDPGDLRQLLQTRHKRRGLNKRRSENINCIGDARSGAHTAYQLNRAALAQLRCEKQLVIVPGATYLFEEPGTLDEVARLAREWFHRHLIPVVPHATGDSK
jgi:hypothetical protein